MTKKIFREIWFNKFRSISIISVVAITVAMFSGMRAGYPMLLASYNLNREISNVADGRFTFLQPVNQDNLTVIKNNDVLLSKANIDRIDGRILFQTSLLYKGEKFQAMVIGVDYPNEVNELIIEAQAEDITNTSQLLAANNSCIIETHFAGQNIHLIGQDVALNDTLSIDFIGQSVNFSVKAIAQDTDYLYVVDETTQMPMLGELAIVWINLARVQELRYSNKPFINQILFTVKDRFNKSQIFTAADELAEYFTSNNIDANSLQFETFDETLEYKMFEADAGSLDSMGTIFGIIGLIICSIIIFNTLSKLVNSQRKNIGLFLAMGACKHEILFHYVGVTLILATIGVVIGVPLGYELSIGMVKMVTKFYAIHYLSYILPASEFIIGGAITIGICFFFSLFSAWPITTVTPREAMTPIFTRIKATGKSMAEKIFGWLPLFKPIHMVIPLREVFMKKKKTLVTILALTTSMVFLVDSLAMEYNMYKVMTDNFNKYNTSDIQITLQTPLPVEEINHFLKKQSNTVLQDITHSEIFIDLYIKITHKGEFATWAKFVCYQENSTIRNYNVIKGMKSKEELGPTKVLLGKSIAGKYDIKLYDDISIGILGNYEVEVVGIVGELIDFSVMWTYEAYQESTISPYFGLMKGWANGIAITVKEGTNLKALRTAFEEQFEINRWTETETAKNSARALMESMMGIMLVFLFVGLAIGVVFSFQAMYIAFVDREMDFLALRAMGAKMKHVRRIIFWENAILSLIGTILTIPFGYLFYFWSMNYILKDKFYIPMRVPWFTWPIVLVLALFAIWLATMRLVRKIKTIKLHDELRVTGAT